MGRVYKCGADRFQEAFLPNRIEDYISSENSVRAIDAYVDSLDLEKHGFKNSQSYHGAGQPPYSPAMHLKLYFWGYFNRIRSSRRLEQECTRNLEVIWLLQSLKPGFRSIADFRKDNAKALRKVHREFIIFCKSLGLFSGELIAIDSVYLEGDASRASVMTKGKLNSLIKQIDAQIDEYLKEIDKSDTLLSTGKETEVSQELNDLHDRKEKIEKMLSEWEEHGISQVGNTDPDARILQKSTGKGPTTGYQIQAAVDEKNKLIAYAEALVDTTDSEALVSVIETVQDTLEVDKSTVLVDSGYFSGKGVEECEEKGVELYMPVPDREKTKREAGLFSRSDFTYDEENNCYVCPNNKVMPFRTTVEKKGVHFDRYYGYQKVCRVCPLRSQCLPEDKSRYRTINRSEHEDSIDRLRMRMLKDGEEMMRKRSGLAEHPFGTIKNNLGWTHFLVRGIEKVRGELALIITTYNFRRVLNIIGINNFIAACSA